jgi:hypothetical protein
VTSVFQYPRLDAGRVAPLPALNRVAVASILALSIFSPSVAARKQVRVYFYFCMGN